MKRKPTDLDLLKMTHPSQRAVTIDRVPTWACSGDPVINREGRLFIQSALQTEPRWRQILRRTLRPVLTRALKAVE